MKKLEFDYCIVRHDENRMTIDYYNNSGSQSIQRNDIGEINNFSYVYLKRQTIHYSFRAILLGVAIIIIGLMLYKTGGFAILILWIGSILAIGGMFSFFIDMVLDGLLGTNYAYKLCPKYKAGFLFK